MFGAKEGAGQVGCQGIGPAGFAHRRGIAHFTKRAGIIEGNIETAEILQRRMHDRLGEGFVAHIAGDGVGNPALLGDFLYQ